MENQLINDIEQEMLSHLDNHQMEQFHKVLAHYLRGVTTAPPATADERSNEHLLTSFLAAKRVEGCSSKSLRYYESTLKFTALKQMGVASLLYNEIMGGNHYVLRIRP